jgi:competence ComEA-like helix-hairpin-helix protein
MAHQSLHRTAIAGSLVAMLAATGVAAADSAPAARAPERRVPPARIFAHLALSEDPPVQGLGTTPNGRRAQTGVAAASAEPAPAATPEPVSGRVNLNTASAEQLRRLPGIGTTKAQRIITWRRAHGRFLRVKDLRRVRGFGRKTVVRLEPYLTVREPASAASAPPP